MPDKLHHVVRSRPRLPAVLVAYRDRHLIPEGARHKADRGHAATRVAEAGIRMFVNAGSIGTQRTCRDTLFRANPIQEHGLRSMLKRGMPVPEISITRIKNIRAGGYDHCVITRECCSELYTP